MTLSTRFFVDKELDRKLLYQLAQEWLSESDRYDIELPAFDFESTEDLQISSENNQQRVVVNNYKNRFILQLVDVSDSITYTTNFVLDDVSSEPSLHISQDTTLSVMSADDKEIDVQMPDLFKSIFWNELGGMDGDILTDNKYKYIRKKDKQFIADILSNKSEFLLPILYVTANKKTGTPDVDPDELAQNLMGQAHVFVEASPIITPLVKELCDGDIIVPQNGSVKLVLPGGESKVFTGSSGSHIVTAVRRIMASVSIGEDFNINRIRQQHVFEKLSNTEDKELYEMAEKMLSEKDSEINIYKKEIADLKEKLRHAASKVSNLQGNLENKNEENETGNRVTLSVNGAEMYEGEIVDVVLRVLQKEYNSMKDDGNLSVSRKFDVLGDVLEHNFPCTTDTELINCIKGAFKDGTLTRNGIGSLQSAGFVVEKDGRSSHYKIYMKGFKKYHATVSSTPSDKACGSKNTVSDFCNVLFGY